MATYSAGEAAIRITSDLSRFAGELRRDLERIEINYSVDVEADLTRFRRQLEQLRAEDFRIDIQADLDSAAARAALDALTRDRTVNVDVDVNGRGLGSLGSSMGSIGSQAGGVSSALTSMAGATAGIVGVSSAIAGLGGAAGVALGAVGALAIGLSSVGVAGAAGIGTLMVGLNGIQDAFSAVGSASSGAGGAATDSARAVTTAENALTSAVKGEKRAQEDVARARKDALEQLEDYNLELRSAALSERDAVLSLAEARRDLAEGDFDDPLERQRAVLQVAEAEQRLAEVRESNGDLEEKATDARQKGVDQADVVVAANDRLAESQARVAEAQMALADAQSAGAAGGGGIDKAAEALAKLSPNAREFVLAMTALKPAWDELQSSVQDKMFDGLGVVFTDLATTILPTLQSGMGLVATSINGAAREFAAFWSSAAAQDGLQAVFAGTADFITALQPGLALLTQGFLSMVQAMEPAMATIGEGFSAIFGQIGLALGQIDTSFFTSFGEMLAPIGALLADVIRMLTEMGAVVMPALGPLFLELGDALVAMAGPVGEMGAAFATALTPVLPVLAELISAMADSLMPLLPILSVALQTVGNALATSLPIAAPVVEQLAELFASLLAAVAPLLPPLIQLTAAILTPLIGIVQQVVTALTPFIAQLVSQLTPVIEALTPVLAEVGRLIGDALVEALGILLPLMGPFVQSLVSLLNAMLPMLPAWTMLAVELLPLTMIGMRTMLPVLTILIQAFSEWAQLVMPLVITAITAVTAVVGVLSAAVSGLLAVWTTVMNGIRDGVTGAKDWVTGRFDELVSFITGMAPRITNAATGMWDGIQASFKNALNWIIEKWNNLELKMPEVKIPNPLPGDNDFKIGGQTLKTPDIKPLAAGGSVSGPGGPRDDRVLIAASNGEYVVNAASTAAYRPLIEAINSGSLPKFADGGQIVNGSEITTSVQQTMWDAVRNEFPDATLNSGTRYADVGSGYDYHMQGMALDLGGPLGDIARWIYGLNATQPVTELIHAPLDGWENLKDGAPLNYGAGTDSQHYDHVHWAMTSFSGATPAPPAPWEIPGGDYQSGTPGADAVPGWSSGDSSTTSSPDTSTSGSGTGSTAAATGSSPSSWSDVAAVGASAFAKGMVSDLLGVFGIPDAMPPAVQAYNELQNNMYPIEEKPVTTAGVDNSGDTGVMPKDVPTTPTPQPAAPTPAPAPAPVDNSPQGSVRRAFQPMGWDTGAQWDATDFIVTKESGWNPLARNPSSGAFGLFQFLGSTKDQYLPDENPDSFVQGLAGRSYIGDRYGTPVDARAAWEAQGWYADGGYVSGAGGPRSDSIPAFLSNGEYVVNSMATRQNMPVLEAINSGQQVGGGHYGDVVTYKISTARVEDAFLEAQHSADRKAAMAVGRWK